MSSTVDVNILVYASDETSDRHHRGRALLDHLGTGPAILYVFWPVLLGYLRIVTHPTITDVPLTSATAMANIETLIGMAHVRTPGEGDGFWGEFRSVAASAPPRGALVPDLHIAALMREHGVRTIWTNDRDFRKFDGITVRDPYDERYAAGFG